MLKSSSLIAILVIFLLAGDCIAQKVSGDGTTKPTDKKFAMPSNGNQSSAGVVGAWRADSITTTKDGEKNETKPTDDKPASVIITEKNLTLRMGKKVISEMHYVVDRKEKPWHFDLKSPDGEMHGICKLDDDDLTISLNDGEVRPAKLDETSNGMTLVLKRFHNVALFMIDADGKNLHEILKLPEYTAFNSPKLSPDNSRIVWDAYRSVMGEKYPDAHVIAANADGSALKDLGAGIFPSWSPDSKEIVFDQPSGKMSGVWIMKVDGTGRRLVDRKGRSPRWSNTSNEIVYVTSKDGRSNLCVHDVVKGESRTLLDRTYGQISALGGWSPDDKWICILGSLPGGGREIAAVSRDGEKNGFKVILPRFTTAGGTDKIGTCWAGLNSQILLKSGKSDRDGKFYIFDFTADKPPVLFPGIPESWPVHHADWSRDGKRVVFAATPVSQ